MARQKMAPGSIGKVSYTLNGPVPHRVKARARLCLPDLDSRNPLSGAYEPGAIVFVEAQGADESAALAALHLAQTARLTSQREEHDRPSTETGTRARTAKRAQTVAEAATAAIAKMVKAKRLASSSAYVYRLHIVRHLAVSDLGKMAVSEVRPRHLEDYLSALAQGSGQATAKEGAAPTGMATAKAGRAVLNRTFGDARRAELIDTNPMLDVGTIAKPKPKRKSKTEPQGLSHDRALDKGERVALAWAVARDETAKSLDIRDFVLAGLALGGRIGELSAIRWCDVEFVADGTGTAKVRLAATVDRVTGLGLVRREPKTVSSERTVPVARRIAALLRRRALTAGVDLARLPECELPVFPAPGRWPDQPIVYRDRANTTKVLRGAFDRAGFEWLSMHGIRRTAVTQLADVLPIRQAADFAGHASVRTTLDHYVGRGQVSDRVASLL